MVDHHESFYPLLFALLGGVLVLCSFLVLTPRFVGHVAVSGVGGQVTTLQLEAPRSALSWVGVYGNLTPAVSNSTFSLAGGEVVRLDVRYADPFTPQTVVVASLDPAPDWSSLLPASRASIDSFLGLPPSDPLSAESTLRDTENFTLGGVTYSLWSASASSLNGSFVTGALESQGSLLFVTRPVVSGLGFDGSPVEYEMLLPVPPNGSSQYSFFVFEQSSFPGSSSVDCNGSANLTASLASDNASVVVSWDHVPGASGYELLLMDGPFAGTLDAASASALDVGSSTSWTDVSPPAERLYELRVTGPGGSCVMADVAGTLSLDLSSDYNLVSTPFVPRDASVAETLRGIDGEYSEVLVLNNTNKVFDFYIIVGQNVFKNFDNITAGRGYWVRADRNVTLRLAGPLAPGIDEFLVPDYSLVGFPLVADASGDASVPHVLSSIEGDYSEVLVLNNTNKVFDYYIIVGQNVFKNFDNISEGRGYWVRTVNDTRLSYSWEGVS